MSIPFARLMEYAASLTPEDLEEPLGQLAARAGVFPERLADALEAVRVCNGVTPAGIRAVDDPVVREALETDRSGMASGVAAPDLFS